MRFFISEMKVEDDTRVTSALLTNLSQIEAQRWMAGSGEVIIGSQECSFADDPHEKTMETILGLDDLAGAEVPVQRLLEAIFMLGFQAGKIQPQTVHP